jgi:hypothetical protein
MDLLLTDRWLIPFIFREDDLPSEGSSTEDKALNEFFDENGYSTLTLIKNLGSTFVYLGIFSIFLLMIPLTKPCSKASSRYLFV